MIAYDLQGHGLSGTIDGLKGYADRFDDWVRELDAVISQLAGPVFLFGESMGGSIVLRALTVGQGVFPSLDRIRGVILSGPVVRVAAEVLPPPPVVFIITSLAAILPRLSVPSSEVADGFEGAFGDKVFAARAKKDPLVIFDSPRLRAAAEILGTVAKTLKGLPLIQAPMLILHGDQDKRTHSGNSEELYAKISSTDKTLHIIQGGNHQLLQDTPSITADVMTEIENWLVARIGSSSFL